MIITLIIISVVLVVVFAFGISNICTERPTKASFVAITATACLMSAGVCVSLFYILSQKIPEADNFWPGLVIFSFFFSFIFLIFSVQKEGKTKVEQKKHLLSAVIFWVSTLLQSLWLFFFFISLFDYVYK